MQIFRPPFSHYRFWLRLGALVVLLGTVLFQSTSFNSTGAQTKALRQARAQLTQALARFKHNRSQTNTQSLQKALKAYRAAGGVEPMQGGGLAARPVLGRAAGFAVSPAAKNLPEVKYEEPKPDPGKNNLGEKEIVRGKKNEFPLRRQDPNGPGSKDPVVQRAQAPVQNVPPPINSFPGLSNNENIPVFGGPIFPPDTVGDVGPNHYVQAINAQFRVYDKTTGAGLTPIASLGSLWASLPGACANTNAGDPIVLYDSLADRWLISQFCTIFDPNMHQLIAISKTGDPTGQYYLYDFVMPNNKFHDYPHYGVWPDAYYLATNQFNQAGTSYLGAGAFALDRQRMLQGDPTASYIYFDVEPIDPLAGGMLPADLDGVVTPPVGAPNVFMEYRADENNDPFDAIRPYEFHVDFAVPGNSSFTVRPDVKLAAFDARNPTGRSDIEQPAPATPNSYLDSVADRLMHRLAYRTLPGGEQSFVLNFTVNVSGENPLNAAAYQAGIRWVELQRTGLMLGALTVNNEGTYAPGGENGPTGRNIWMGSIAQDYLGNIALGFSAASTTLFPSILYAGRLASDPPGQLAQGENTMQTGGGAQTATGQAAGRWGDYSAMSVDPTDECTFWYTQGYYSESSVYAWATRFGSFRIGPTNACTPQTKGVITGTITNCATGAPIEGAVITTGNGLFRQSGADGKFSISVAPGDYLVSVTPLAGFSGECQRTVTVAGGATVTVNCCLQPLPVLLAAGTNIVNENCAPANNAIDPGETVTVSFCVKNTGAVGGNTANLIGTLQTGNGVTAPSAAQTYGALTAGGAAVCRNFTFTATADCGDILTAALQLQDGANNRGTAIYTFQVGRINPFPLPVQTYSTGNLAVPIPDNGFVDVPINIPERGAISDLNVRVRLNHTYNADLRLSLIAPDNTTLILADSRGSGGDNYGSGANNCSGAPTIFDDAALTTIAAGAAPFVGTFRPEQSLSIFNGENAQGTWRLRVEDQAGADLGVIGCFTLEVVRQSYVCCGLAGAPLVRNGATTLVAENCPANNNAIDPNEQVTVNFTFTNAGTGSTDNLTATLQSSGGVIPITTTQSYGAIPAGGAATRPFTLAATSTCGGTITATFQLQDGASNLGVFNFAFALGTPTTTNFGPFANPADIVIPAFGAAALYPSNITVAGVTGTVSKVTVRLANLYHTFPDDVDILLVGPTGQKFILMADAGGSADANEPLTFDDAAVLSLPDSGGLPSGVYRPTDHLDSDAFPPPAPAAPYLSPAPTGTATLASTFNGLDPNGAWSLYVTDDTGGDEGIVIGGWSLNIATTASSCCVPPPFRPAPQSSLVLSDPLVCAGPGRVVNGSLQLVNPGTTATNGSLTTTLPPQLLALANTCTANFGACTSNATTIFWSGTIPAGQTLNINYAAQVTDAALAGAEICAVTTANFPPAAPVSVQPCLTINCPAIGPGATHPAAAEASDQRSGAALVYNLYTSNAAAPNAQNTRFSITNTEPSRAAAVHLFFVDGQTCSVADAFVCLTPNQTSSFLASDLDPGTTGYLIAIASDLLTGCPINFNYLIGEAYVKLASGHAANLGAEAIAALAGSPPNCQAFATTAQLNFDGVSYNRVPRVLALSNIPARRDGNDTLLVLNRFGGNLARSAGTLSDIFGIVYDDAENAISFSFSPGVCQFRAVLSNSFPRITPRLENFIPAGRSGWARLYSLSDIGIFGATLNFNANARIASGAFNQGRNLHKLTLTATQTLIIPIFPPGC